MKRSLLKRIVATITVTAVLVSLLGGCTSAPSPTGTTPSKTNSAAVTEEPKVEGVSFPLKEKIKLKLFYTDDAIVNDDNLMITELEKRTNIDFDLIQALSENATERQAVLLASGDLPDIMILRGEKNYALNSDKTPLFLNMKDYYNNGKMPNLKAWTDKYPRTQGYNMDKEGNLFAFTMLEGGAEVTETFLTAQGNLDKYANGKVGSYDELYKYMTSWKQANPKNYPWTCVSWGLGGWYLIGCQLVLADCGWSGVDFDYGANEYKVMPYKTEYKKTIEWLAKCYAEGLIDPNFTTNSDQQFSQNLTTNKSLFAFNYVSQNKQWTIDGRIAQKDNNFKMTALPYLKRDDGTQSKFLAYLPGGLGGFYRAVSKETKYPDVCVAFLDYLIQEDVAMLTAFGIEGVTYEKDSNGSIIMLTDAKKAGQESVDKIAGVPSKIRAINFVMPPLMKDDLDKDLQKSKQMLVDQNALNPRLPAPGANAEESKKIAEIVGPAETFIHENVLKFVVGVRPMSEWDNFITDLKKLNLDYVAEVYNKNK